jgi:exonuclease VII small subunit
MDIEEFEAEYRTNMEETLNQLQTAVLLLAKLESKLVNVGQNLQNISQTVEDFVIQQRDK